MNHHLTWERKITIAYCRSIALFVGMVICIGCSGPSRFRSTLDTAEGSKAIGSFQQSGGASYYAREFHGRRTASGERYNMHKLTAAHRTLPFTTRVRVTNLRNNQSVVVRINDRGPFKKGRIIDVSYEAAKRIGLLGSGTGTVKIEVVK